MKKFVLKDPSGDTIATMAPSLEKARANFTYRLTRQPYGMFVADAKAWAADAKEAK